MCHLFTCQCKRRHINHAPWAAGNTAEWVWSVSAVRHRRGGTLVNCHSNHHLPPVVAHLIRIMLIRLCLINFLSDYWLASIVILIINEG